MTHTGHPRHLQKARCSGFYLHDRPGTCRRQPHIRGANVSAIVRYKSASWLGCVPIAQPSAWALAATPAAMRQRQESDHNRTVQRISLSIIIIVVAIFVLRSLPTGDASESYPDRTSREPATPQSRSAAPTNVQREVRNEVDILRTERLRTK